MDTDTEEVAVLNEEQRGYVDGMTHLLELIQLHPDIFNTWWQLSHTWSIRCATLEEMMERARKLGGRWEKDANNYSLEMRRPLNERVALTLTVAREDVCTKIKTGTKMVTKPDPDVVRNAPMVTVEEDTFEYVCPPSFLEAAKH